MKVRSWSYGINSLKRYRYGTLHLVEQPAWLALCERAIDMLGYGCRVLHWIKFPGLIKFKSLWPEQGPMTLREYYGDLGHVWHCEVYDPLFQWYYAHKKRARFDVEVGYDKVKELFGGKDTVFFAEHESRHLNQEEG